MNKHLLSILTLFTLISSISSQNLGNEWIDYSQKYFQFKVYETGWYRVEFSQLDNAFSTQGIDLSVTNIDDLHLFGREKEQALRINDGGDGFLNSGDYIEFWAEKNDGWKDSAYYNNPSTEMPDSYYSFVNDTIFYYLTIGNSSNGKRYTPETDVNFSGYPQADFCWVSRYVRHVTSEYNYGPLTYNLSSPTYGTGEGWTGSAIRAHNSTTINNNNYKIDSDINTLNAYTGVDRPNAKIRSSIASASDPSVSGTYNHSFIIQYGSGMTTIYDTSFAGYKLIKTYSEVDPNTLTNGNTRIRHRGINIGQGNNEKLTLSSTTIDYPHTFDFEGQSEFSFSLPNSSLDVKQSILISNISGGSPSLFILNDGAKEIPLTLNGGNYEAVIPNNNTNDSIQLLFVDSDVYKSVSSISPVRNNGNFFDYSTIDPHEAFIIITNEKLWPSATDYAAYRSSPAGGSQDVVLVDIAELYHQFGGGIEKHSVAIRNFVEFGFQTWSTEPQHLFLLGKSISNKANGNFGSRENNTAFQLNLVPTWGYPGSDNHLTQGVNNSGKSYALATGRLSVSNNQAVYDYLDKIIAYDAQQDPNSLYNIPNKEWQKNTLLFGGGSDSTEIIIIDYYLDNFKSTLGDSAIGAMNHTFIRDPFATALDASSFFEVQQLLEDGVSLITFYGHSSASLGFSQNIDAPENWNNQDKYPIVVGLGCYTGDVHNIDTNTYATQLVHTANEGSICIISTVSLGFITTIGNYTELFYKNLGQLNYGESLGQNMKNTCDSIFQLQGAPYWQVVNESNITGMSIQGDPFISMNHHDKPELVLDKDRVWTVPAQIDLSVDSFDLYVVNTNIGRGYRDDYYLNVERVTPNGIDTSYSVLLSKSLNRDTVIFRFPTDHSNANGLNQFNISVDLPFSEITEQQDETGNNQLTYTTFITSNGLKPIWPYEYAIIPHDTITLKASTLNPFESLKSYIFEIDTTDKFNSPFKKTQYIESIGGVIEAHPQNWINSSGIIDSLVYTDSTVYFWRCSPDSTVKNWLESSFQYIPNHWGWGQAHFEQFKNDAFQGLTYNYTDELFEFGNNYTKLSVSSYINFVTGAQWEGTTWFVNGVKQDYGGWTVPSIMLGVVDQCDLHTWKTPYEDDFGNILNAQNCFGQFNGDPNACPGTNNMGRDREHGFFLFRLNNPVELDSLASLLDNKIPDGSYVVLYSYIPDGFSSPTNLYASMTPNLISALQNFGATGISSSQPDDGFILFGRQGVPSEVREIHSGPLTGASGDPLEHLVLNDTLFGCEIGYATSEIVGPAFEWNKIVWHHKPMEINSVDSTQLKIYGIKQDNTSSLLIDTVMYSSDSILSLNTIIDADVYPMLRLQAELHDTITKTPAQLKRWQVIYDPVPELAINPKKGYYFKSENYQAGDTAKIAVAIENVSEFDMDSLLVDYYLINQGGARTEIDYDRQDSLMKHQFLLDTLSIPTNSLSGSNYFWMAANPFVTDYDQDQLEQFYFNNIAQKTFNVDIDDVNPILDVTFDGIHILDEDIVSAKPNILITLDDENEFLLLDEIEDTSNFEIFIKEPEANTFKRIYFMVDGQENLIWTPAQDSKNKFKIEYNPTYTEDGIYTLKVQGRDKSDNFSGDFDYEISYEVVTRSTITYLYNYPNPFSTNTQFVFTLTGSKLPDDMLIQIMTVSGKVVKEIEMYELGPLRVGNNVTEYAWDGRDNFGDQLANGVYLYRVIAEIDGQNIEHRSTAADDKAFTKGFGKMYLMR